MGSRRPSINRELPQWQRLVSPPGHRAGILQPPAVARRHATARSHRGISAPAIHGCARQLRQDGRPLYSMVLAGRGKKNGKSLDLILAALFVLMIRRSVQGSDGYILANEATRPAMTWRWRASWLPAIRSFQVRSSHWRASCGFGMVARRSRYCRRGTPLARTARSRRLSATMKFGHIATGRLMEAMQPDPTRADTLQWVTSYARLFTTAGAPLHDLMQIGKAGKDPRMLFSWYSGDFAPIRPLPNCRRSSAPTRA